jgi:hypothetical protein
MKRTGILFAAAVLFGGLACLRPEPVIYRVALGMSEQRLLEAVGPPVTIQEADGGKTLEYESWGKNLRGQAVHPRTWFVHLSQGKVDRYGWREPKAEPRSS